MTRIALIVAIIVAVSSAAFAQITSSSTNVTLQRAMAYQFQFRAGQTDVVAEYAAMLEESAQANPDNADLANAMGLAYLAQSARAMMPGGRPADPIAALPKGRAALERAMQLNPNHDVLQAANVPLQHPDRSRADRSRSRRRRDCSTPSPRAESQAGLKACSHE